MIDKMVEGFVPIAIRDDYGGNMTVSFNAETKKFLLSTNGKLAGPYSLEEIKVLKENLNDVIEMNGMYLFLTAYTVQGEQKG